MNRTLFGRCASQIRELRKSPVGGAKKILRAMRKRFVQRGRIYRLDFLAHGMRWHGSISWLHGAERIDPRPSALFGEFTDSIDREVISGWNDGQALVTLKGVVVSPHSPFVYGGNLAISTMNAVGPSFGEVKIAHHLNQHRHKPFRLGPDVFRLVTGPIQPKAQLPRIREGVYALMPKFGRYNHLANEFAPRLQMLVSTRPEFADVPVLVPFLDNSSHPKDSELRGINLKLKRLSVVGPTYVETLHILAPPTLYDLTSGKEQESYSSLIPRGFSASMVSDQSWRELIRVGRQDLTSNGYEASSDFSKVLFFKRTSGVSQRLIVNETRALGKVEAAYVVDKVAEDFFHTATVADLHRYLARYSVIIVTVGSFLSRLFIAMANLRCTLVIIYPSGRQDLYNLWSHLGSISQVRTVGVVALQMDDGAILGNPEDLFRAVKFAMDGGECP